MRMFALMFALCVFARVMGAFGLLLIRSSSLVEKDRPWFWRPRFLAGLSLQGIIPAITDGIAFALLPLSANDDACAGLPLELAGELELPPIPHCAHERDKRSSFL